MNVVDSHCHLDYPGLTEDLEGIVRRAGEQGVRLMLTIGTRVRRFDQVLAIAERHDNVFCTIGTHPHHAAEECDVTVRALVELAAHPKVVGIGEAGLDYHYDNSPREVQAESFRVHIGAARETGLPLVIHSRSAEEDTASILEDEMTRGVFKPLLHCFSSNWDLARRSLALGAYVSFSGILTYKNAEDIRETARRVPENRLLVETDAPYLAPVPFRGKTNEPAFVVKTLETLASLRHISAVDLAAVTSENFFTLFDKVPRPAWHARAA